MLEVLKNKIVKLLNRRDYTPHQPDKLAEMLGVSKHNNTDFLSALDDLRRTGHIVIGSRNLVSLAPLSSPLVGTFRLNPKGFGFVIPLKPTSHGDLFIPPDGVDGAMNGDIVLARVIKERSRRREPSCRGKILEVLERAENRFVGTLRNEQHQWLVQPDGAGFARPIAIEDVGAKGAHQNDKVLVEILSYPSKNHDASGVIIEVLGKAGRYEAEINSIIHQYHLPGDFPSECTEQARRAVAGFDADRSTGRQDVTDMLTITIDPEDAKDFDDAISLETDEQGNFILGVHIADVSHFVGADSPLDTEARERGNSVYLPGKTLPMLPEILSNGLCSLQPGQKRFAKSVYLTYDRQGNLLAKRFANSIIRSDHRLTYQQADSILNGRPGPGGAPVSQLLERMEQLSRTIEKRRKRNGMLHLDLPETELEMDDAGRVVDAHPADESYPHTIIEMFMVEANEAVASLLDRLNIPFMRRIHPEPDALTLKNLSRLVKAFGLSLPRDPDRISIQALLNSVKDQPSALAVNLMVLRSFEKAQYAALHIGHYALASGHYCHFTSPIRRYADLLVHRLLHTYVQNTGRPLTNTAVPTEQDLAETGKHISFTEQRAEDAEDELKTVLILQLLSNHIGDRLDCIVTGLTSFGAFAQSRKFGIEGLIRLEDLGGDRWRFDPGRQCIEGIHTGCTLRLGRPIKTNIASVNVPARQLNFYPAEPLAAAGQTRHRNKSTRKGQRGRTGSRKKNDA